ASELGNSRVTNMVMFGAFVEKSDLVSIDLLMENLLEILGAKKAKLLDANKEAIQVGFNYKGE
ncbi:MAG: 2-oxoacid:acceptor oxidoreductase family protein, partial [Halobacteriota archaeon]|nr:2-oxoacid:acceptor oxidoreductase family protein [Halobacteriota archaeon]